MYRFESRHDIPTDKVEIIMNKYFFLENLDMMKVIKPIVFKAFIAIIDNSE